MHDPPKPLLSALKRVLEQRKTLSRGEARELLDSVLDPAQGRDSAGSDLRLAALLGALAARGETQDELTGFVESLRTHATPIPLDDRERALLVDTCGTGGDQAGTFNISTAAALVAAAAGENILVAKHGNRAVTSRAGSADVLEALGIPVALPPELAASALRTHHFAFLSAPLLQPAMKSVVALRRSLGVRTAFNLVGPMTNPAGARAQILGVFAEHLVPLVARTLVGLGCRHAFVLHGSTGPRRPGGSAAEGLDEFSLAGPTSVAEVLHGRIRFFSVTPRSFGLAEAPIAALAGGTPRANAEILRRIFAGERGPQRDVVVMNAAAVLVTAGLARHFLEGARLAESTVDSGRVSALVAKLAASSPTQGTSEA